MTDQDQIANGVQAGKQFAREHPTRLVLEKHEQLCHGAYGQSPYVRGFIAGLTSTRVTCADCMHAYDPHELPSHECKQQRAANRKAQRGARG